MDCLDNETLLKWLDAYGSIALFVLLALGIVALPIPDETLIVLSGILIHNGHLNATPTIIAAFAGGICGISISYFLGRSCGHFLIHKYGSWFGLTESKLNTAHEWFEHYGKWTLLIGYFIPGVRHFTGLVAGLVELEYKHFAIFAYTGAVIWASVFLTIGYFFGNYCFKFIKNFDIKDDQIFLATAAVLAACFGIFVLMKSRKKS